MKLVKKSEIHTVANSKEAIVEEYLHNDPDLNLAIGNISARYPSSGFVVNEISKELVYVLEGSIDLILKDQVVHLGPADSVIIDKNELFAWDGQAKLLTVCLPAWEASQHKEVKE
jgi:ethanolamine utilization protein EutQ (cupin superfamily)